MIPQHVLDQLKQRELNYSPIFLLALAEEYDSDTAILLKKLPKPKNCNQSADYHKRELSNGNLVILIVRDKRPITIFFRRDDQPFTPQALRVQDIKIWY